MQGGRECVRGMRLVIFEMEATCVTAVDSLNDALYAGWRGVEGRGDETTLESPVECGSVFHPFVQSHNRNVSAQQEKGQCKKRVCGGEQQERAETSNE